MQCLQGLKYPFVEDGNQLTLAHLSLLCCSYLLPESIAAVMTKHMDDTPNSETYVSVSWGRLEEAGKLHLRHKESWKSNKEGGQIKCATSIDNCQRQVCFKFHVAVANAWLSSCNPHYPFCRVTEVTSVLSWGSPHSAPPAEPALLKYCCGHPQAEGSCCLPPWLSASGLTPVIRLLEEGEGIADTVQWWGLEANKEKKLLVFKVVIAH